MLTEGPEPLYVAARRVLLDAHDALGKQCEALVLVGAQAVYLRTGDAGLGSVAPFTSDADLSIDPSQLDDDPAIGTAMTRAGFTLKVKEGNNGVEPGAWLTTVEVNGRPTVIEVDLMVPQTVAPGRGRDAKLPKHGKNASRITPGLEASIVDHEVMTISSLELDRDARTAVLRVAGCAALLIAKAHKLGERVGQGKQHRIKPKDAGDIFRLMRSPQPPEVIGERLARLAENPICSTSVTVGVDHLDRLFGTPRAIGVELAVRNLASAVLEEELRVVMPGYLAIMIAAYKESIA